MPAVRLFGLPTDISSSFERGAAAGPAAIREALWSDRGNMASELGPEIGADITLTDDGDGDVLAAHKRRNESQPRRLIQRRDDAERQRQREQEPDVEHAGDRGAEEEECLDHGGGLRTEEHTS